MHEFVNFNCRILPAEQSYLAAISSAALYGKGVFTTVAVYNSKPFQWQKHWQRLKANAEKTGVDFSGFSQEIVENSLAEIIVRNKVKNGRARLTVFDESASRIWQNEPKTKTSFLIQTADFRAASDDFRLTVSPFAVNSKSPLAGVKSCNYLENILAMDEARASGFDEAVRLNGRGEAVSGIMANIFWIKNGQIFTPALETGCLYGTTRDFILENFAVAETAARIKEIFEADEIFLTSAGIGIARVKNFDGRTFPPSSKIFTQLQNIFPTYI